jgi:putative hydrolase of the HAD superfamily
MVAPDTTVGAPEIELILFDLGGVLVELSGVATMLGWLGQTLTVEDLWRRWLLSPAVRRFEQGHCMASEFARAVVEEFGLPISADEFLRAFTGWPRSLYPGVIPLLEFLRDSYTLACFSNNNALHWEHICTNLGLGRYFAQQFPSHLTGYMKPDRDAFVFVLGELHRAPERILFLDDNSLNVDAALRVGMRARRTSGVSEVVAALTEYGIALPASLRQRYD